jgi:hypothetical protein
MGLFELTYSSEQYNDAVLDGLLVRATHEQMELINRIREKIDLRFSKQHR